MAGSNAKLKILDLNEDCLKEIFSKCDGEILLALTDTCQCFKNIIETYNFRKVDHYKCLIRRNNDINKVRRVINLIGKNLRKLYIKNYEHYTNFRLIGEQ